MLCVEYAAVAYPVVTGLAIAGRAWHSFMAAMRC